MKLHKFSMKPSDLTYLFMSGDGGDGCTALHSGVLWISITGHVMDLSGQDGEVFSQVLTQPGREGTG